MFEGMHYLLIVISNIYTTKLFLKCSQNQSINIICNMTKNKIPHTSLQEFSILSLFGEKFGKSSAWLTSQKCYKYLYYGQHGSIILNLV